MASSSTRSSSRDPAKKPNTCGCVKLAKNGQNLNLWSTTQRVLSIQQGFKKKKWSIVTNIISIDRYMGNKSIAYTNKYFLCFYM